MQRARSCVTFVFLSLSLSGCGMALLGPAMLGGTAATGMMSSPTNVTGNYTDEEFEACLASLGPLDIQRAQDAAEAVMFIPGVGPLLAEEQMYEEIEEICQEDGVLPQRSASTGETEE